MLFDAEVAVWSQIDSEHVVEDHGLRSQLTQEEELVLPALAEKLALDVHVEGLLQRVEVESRVLRGSANDVIEDLLASEVEALLFGHQLDSSALRKSLDLLQEGHYLETVQEEPKEKLVEEVLLLRKLPTEQSVGDEDQGVLESVLLVAHEVITRLAFPQLVPSCLLLSCTWTTVVVCWALCLQKLGLVWREHLGLELEFLVDYFLDDSHQNVNHCELSMEGTLELGQQKPLKPQIEAFASKQLLEAVHVADSVCTFHDGSHLLHVLNKDLLDWKREAMADHCVLESERAHAALRDCKGSASDRGFFGCLLACVHALHSKPVAVWVLEAFASSLAQNRTLSEGCHWGSIGWQDALLHLAQREHKRTCTRLHQPRVLELLFSSLVDLLSTLVGKPWCTERVALFVSLVIETTSRQEQQVKAMLGEAAGTERLIQLFWLAVVFLVEVRPTFLVSLGQCWADTRCRSLELLLLRRCQPLELPHSHFAHVWDGDVADCFCLILRNDQGNALANADTWDALSCMQNEKVEL